MLEINRLAMFLFCNLISRDSCHNRASKESRRGDGPRWHSAPLIAGGAGWQRRSRHRIRSRRAFLYPLPSYPSAPAPPPLLELAAVASVSFAMAAPFRIAEGRAILLSSPLRREASRRLLATAPTTGGKFGGTAWEHEPLPSSRKMTAGFSPLF